MLNDMKYNGELDSLITETLLICINNLKDMMVNVRDFGVKGDGETNDTINIQNLIDEFSESKSIYFPSGTYLVSNLKLKPTTKLIGDSKFNTILKSVNKNTESSLIYGEDLDLQHLEIKNLTIDGNKENQNHEINGIHLEMKNVKSFETVSTLQDIIVHDCTGSGLVLNGKEGNNLIIQIRLKDIFSHNNECYGYVLNYVSDSYIDTCECCQNKKGGFTGVLYSTKLISSKAWFNGMRNNGSGFDFEKSTRVTMVACESQDNFGHGIKFKDSTFIDLNVDVDNNGILANNMYERIVRENEECLYSGVYFNNVTRSNINVTGDNFMYSFFGYMQKTAVEIVGGNVITGVIRTRNQKEAPIFNGVDFNTSEFIIDGIKYDESISYDLKNIDLDSNYSLVTVNDMNKLTKKNKHVHLQCVIECKNTIGSDVGENEMKNIFKLPEEYRPNNAISYSCMLGSGAYNFQDLGNLLVSINGNVSIRDIKKTGFKFISICLDYDVD